MPIGPRSRCHTSRQDVFGRTGARGVRSARQTSSCSVELTIALADALITRLSCTHPEKEQHGCRPRTAASPPWPHAAEFLKGRRFSASKQPKGPLEQLVLEGRAEHNRIMSAGKAEQTSACAACREEAMVKGSTCVKTGPIGIQCSANARGLHASPSSHLASPHVQGRADSHRLVVCAAGRLCAACSFVEPACTACDPTP